MKAHRTVLSIFAMALAVALAFVIVPAITDSGGQASAEQPLTLIYYDGHMHTTRSDGTGEVADIKATALARGLDAVIITDHCKDLTRGEWNSLVRETEAVSDGSFLALPSCEVTGSEGTLNRDHILAYDVDDPFVVANRTPEEVWPSPLNPDGTGPMYPENLAKWVEYIHSQGGIAVHAHTSGSTQLGYGVNNIEVYNQSHVEDVVGVAAPLVGEELALQLALVMNNLAIYGERDLTMMVPFPGIDDDGDGLVDEDPADDIDNDGDTFIDEDGPTWLPLKTIIYLVTAGFVEPYIGQWLGSPEAPLNSWDDLLMAYVNGEVERPIFAVANSDAHNTKWTDDPLDSNVGLAKNGLYVKKLTPGQVYKAIKAGHSFATTGPSLAFDVNGELMGDTAVISDGSAELNLSVDSENLYAALAKIDIIKNGEILQTIYPSYPAPVSTYEVTLDDDVTEDGYYRVEVTSQDAWGAYYFAYSNPVFVDIP